MNSRPKGPFIATQLNSTDLLRADWLYAGMRTFSRQSSWTNVSRTVVKSGPHVSFVTLQFMCANFLRNH